MKHLIRLIEWGIQALLWLFFTIVFSSADFENWRQGRLIPFMTHTNFVLYLALFIFELMRLSGNL